MPRDKLPRTGSLARGAITSLAVARAGVAHLGHRVRGKPVQDDPRQAAHEAELGRILFHALNQLKGTALKASQLLSMEASLLPEGVRRELARACHQATPLNRALVHKVFRQEFAQDAEVLFRRFDPHAFAAASLGQVHHAELPDGQPVVVKVQYPGIAASIGSDMRLIRSLLQGLRLGTDLLPGPHIVERLMQDVEHKLAEEVDYLHEAAQLDWFADRARILGVQVPRPVPSHSTRRVLTMQRMHGLHLEAWLATGPSQAVRNRAGQVLFDWFMHCTFDWRRLHADPHPGNFLFQPDGQVAIVDFGCIKQFSPAFTDALALMWRTRLHPPTEGGAARLQRLYTELGLIAPDLPPARFESALLPALAPLLDWQVEPYRHARFDFSTRAPYPQPVPGERAMLSQLLIGMPEELPYLERASLGIQHLLKSLGAEVATRTRWVE